MDNLEHFIRSRREEFDAKEPRDKLWSRIENDISGEKKDYGWLWKAAAVVLLAVCSFLVWERVKYQEQVSPLASEFYLDPEFEETERYYSQLISQKKSIIDQLDVDDPAIKEDFKKDLAALDSMYLALRKELLETSNTSVIDAMINNLQLRMEILNQQVMILEKLHKENSHEKNTIEYL